jgi:hypothetical protein
MELFDGAIVLLWFRCHGNYDLYGIHIASTEASMLDEKKSSWIISMFLCCPTKNSSIEARKSNDASFLRIEDSLRS